jgi:hypothetical protein
MEFDGLQCLRPIPDLARVSRPLAVQRHVGREHGKPACDQRRRDLPAHLCLVAAQSVNGNHQRVRAVTVQRGAEQRGHDLPCSVPELQVDDLHAGRRHRLDRVLGGNKRLIDRQRIRALPHVQLPRRRTRLHHHQVGRNFVCEPCCAPPVAGRRLH